MLLPPVGHPTPALHLCSPLARSTFRKMHEAGKQPKVRTGPFDVLPGMHWVGALVLPLLLPAFCSALQSLQVSRHVCCCLPAAGGGGHCTAEGGHPAAGGRQQRHRRRARPARLRVRLQHLSRHVCCR